MTEHAATGRAGPDEAPSHGWTPLRYVCTDPTHQGMEPSA